MKRRLKKNLNKSEAEPAPSKPANAKPSDIAFASVPATLAMLRVNPETGLTRAEVDARRKEHGYNEVAERREHPVLKFLEKFWGVSAWMLELIMVLSAVLRKYSDLAVVGALLVVNAVLSFVQEHRAAGVVETLRRRLQVSARVRREASWQVIPRRHDGEHGKVEQRQEAEGVEDIVVGRQTETRPADPQKEKCLRDHRDVLISDVLTGTVLTFVGLPGLMPLPGWQTLAIFVYAMVACLVVNDAVKVVMIKIQRRRG